MWTYRATDYTNDFLAHHGIKGQKWGIRRFQNPDGSLTPEGRERYNIGSAAALANRIYSEAKAKEPWITKDVKDAAVVAGSKLHQLENRLKTKGSIERKIKTDALEKGISEKEASKIKDAIRYTSLVDDNNFVYSYSMMKQALQDKGYTEVKCKNYFTQYKQGLVKHKSVTSVFKDPNGYEFEIQFHTPASQKAKDDKVPIYEERRKPNVPVERQKYLEKQMTDLAEKVPYPKNIDEIKSH